MAPCAVVGIENLSYVRYASITFGLKLGPKLPLLPREKFSFFQ